MQNMTIAVRWTAATMILFALSGCGKKEGPSRTDSPPPTEAQAEPTPTPTQTPDEPESITPTESVEPSQPAGDDGLTMLDTGGEPGATVEGFNGQTYSVLSTTTLGSGIIIEELRIGEGNPCPPGATVTMQYHGTLADGTVFDTTRGEGPRGPWSLTSLIQGWQQGVPGMKVGGVRRLTIPYQLAYGEGGRGSIPPKAELTFIIELATIE